MSINRVTISGNLTRDAELRQTARGMAVLGFSVAVNDRVKGEDGQWTDRPNFIDCTMFGKRADAVSRFLSKGSKVAIEGKLRWSQWERDGQMRSKVEVIVDEIEFMSQRQQGQLGSKPVHGVPAAAPAPAQQPCQQQMGGMPQAVGPVTGTIYDDDIPF